MYVSKSFVKYMNMTQPHIYSPSYLDLSTISFVLFWKQFFNFSYANENDMEKW